MEGRDGGIKSDASNASNASFVSGDIWGGCGEQVSVLSGARCEE